MMFGYASDETPEYMHILSRWPQAVTQADRGAQNGTLPYLRPDGKTQVTVEYDESGVPFRLDAVVLSTQHNPEISRSRSMRILKSMCLTL